jgi:hypothetical protein
MTALADLQHGFQNYVLRGEPGVIARIGGAEGIDRQRRLRVYFDAYRLRLLEALAADYEALRMLLGEEQFSDACRSYVEATPSLFRNVRWYGAGLVEFLRTTPPWAEQPVAYELALFEWTLTLAFDAADHRGVRFEDFAGLSPSVWPKLRFMLHPSAHLIALRSNAPALRKAIDAGEPLPRPTLADSAKPWLLWRKELTPRFRSLSEPESWALMTIKDGATFAVLCEGLCRWSVSEQAPSEAATLLRRWVDDELIREIAY